VHYRNLDDEGVRTDHAELIAEVEQRGLLWPVTVVDGVPVYDGAVSYPAIMRAVHNKLLEQAEA